MRINKTTVFGQLTIIFDLFCTGKLEDHPMEELFETYNNILEELASAKEDFESWNEYRKDFDDEELDGLIEYIDELEKRKNYSWRRMMETFVLNKYFYEYVE